jgi:hypothetical protein
MILGTETLHQRVSRCREPLQDFPSGLVGWHCVGEHYSFVHRNRVCLVALEAAPFWEPNGKAKMQKIVFALLLRR